jgi:general secretion pathway protein K
MDFAIWMYPTSRIDCPVRHNAGWQRRIARIVQSKKWKRGLIRRSDCGSAMLLVLFAILLLTGLITATVAFVRLDVDEYAALNKQFRARLLAESGLAFGTNPAVQSQDTALLEQRAPDGGRFRVVISSESTKLNINFILANNLDDLLKTLFGRWGVASKVADTAVDGLHKYLDNQQNAQPVAVTTQPAATTVQPMATPTPSGANGQPTPSAGQSGTLQTQVLTAQFASVAEMSLVPEFAPIMEAQPDWKNFFTIWGDGKLDVNLADADTIALVTGVSAATADQFVKYRFGPDGKPFTTDDRTYNTIDEVRAALGLSPEQFQLVQNYLTLESEIDRIESTGIIAGYEKKIAVVINRNQIPVTYLSWEEN